MHEFFSISILKKFSGDLQQYEKNIYFSLVYFVVRMQYVIYKYICITYKMCVNQLFMISERILVNRLLVVKF